jgi:hypothetical protein
MRGFLTMVLCLAQYSPAFAGTASPTPMSPQPAGRAIEVRASCKQVSSCAEAVELWCNGYRRADADGDGIPCENVCSSREEVDGIRAQIGC